MHTSSELEMLFDSLFTDSYLTCLRGGSEEPLYLPASSDNKGLHRVIYRRDYFASALHEVAHWCLARSARRQQTDYGYWYIQEPRTVPQQISFYQVEQVPQALEWIFSIACLSPFRVSHDNTGQAIECKKFNRLVQERAISFTQEGLPSRAAAFAKQLASHFGGNEYLDPKNYTELPC